MKSGIILVFALALAVLKCPAATKISVASGLWTSNLTWSPSGVPACGDSVIISTGHTVTINSQQSYQGCGSKIIVVLYGTLYFQSGNKLRLPCNSKVYIFINGALDSDGGGNSNQLELCGNTEWKGSMGKVSGPTCFPPNLPGCNSVLPVELAEFKASVCGLQTCFYWQTMVEDQNLHFELQRSADALEFESIIIIPTRAPGGYSRRTLEYSASDRGTNSEIMYYRLRQVDIKGKEEFSRIISVKQTIPDFTDLELFPNPSEGRFIARTGTVQNGHVVLVSIRNVYGQVVDRGSYAVAEGAVEVNTSLEPGLYTVFLSSDAHGSAAKIIIK